MIDLKDNEEKTLNENLVDAFFSCVLIANGTFAFNRFFIQPLASYGIGSLFLAYMLDLFAVSMLIMFVMAILKSDSLISAGKFMAIVSGYNFILFFIATYLLIEWKIVNVITLVTLVSLTIAYIFVYANLNNIKLHEYKKRAITTPISSG